MKTCYRSWRLRRTVFGLLLLTVAAVAGCRSAHKKTTLSGKVVYRDQPVTGGTILLYPPDEKQNPVSGTIEADGTYLVVGPPLGDVKVTISTDSARGMSGNPNMLNMPNSPEAKDANMPDMDVTKILTYVEIPRIYNDSRTTTLNCTIIPGPNTADFTLTDPGK